MVENLLAFLRTHCVLDSVLNDFSKDDLNKHVKESTRQVFLQTSIGGEIQGICMSSSRSTTELKLWDLNTLTRFCALNNTLLPSSNLSDCIYLQCSPFYSMERNFIIGHNWQNLDRIMTIHLHFDPEISLVDIFPTDIWRYL